MKFSTKQIHAGVEPDPVTGSILTPISQTTTFVQPSVDEYLAKEPYNIDKKGRTFFTVHKSADIEHTARAAKALGEIASTEEEQERVRAVCRNMAKAKLGKFDSIYDEY